ncbi:hypothetical protein RCL1_006953 [Eukaryota sp. TZLM3-RCL]
MIISLSPFPNSSVSFLTASYYLIKGGKRLFQNTFPIYFVLEEHVAVDLSPLKQFFISDLHRVAAENVKHVHPQSVFTVEFAKKGKHWYAQPSATVLNKWMENVSADVPAFFVSPHNIGKEEYDASEQQLLKSTVITPSPSSLSVQDLKNLNVGLMGDDEAWSTWLEAIVQGTAVPSMIPPELASSFTFDSSAVVPTVSMMPDTWEITEFVSTEMTKIQAEVRKFTGQLHDDFLRRFRSFLVNPRKRLASIANFNTNFEPEDKFVPQPLNFDQDINSEHDNFIPQPLNFEGDGPIADELINSEEKSLLG